MNGEEGKPYVPIGGPLNICGTCEVRHYDNCAECFGFGVRLNSTSERPLPIGAEEAILGNVPSKPCPVCHSTTAGIPSPESGLTVFNGPSVWTADTSDLTEDLSPETPSHDIDLYRLERPDMDSRY